MNVSQEVLAAVDEAVRISGVERYRYLALDQPDERQRERWQQWAADVAARGALPPMPVDYGTPPTSTPSRPCCG